MLPAMMKHEKPERGAAFIARGLVSRRRRSIRGRNSTQLMSRAERLAARDIRRATGVRTRRICF
eukprot:2280010-Pyramimonas_sp.AAC.1